MSQLCRAIRVSFVLGTLVAPALLPQAAFAADSKASSAEKTKVAVGAFEGAKSKEIRSAFIGALKKDGGYEVTDAEDVKGSAKPKAIVETARNLDVGFVVTGKVAKNYTLKLRVLSGSSGNVVDEVEIEGGALAKLKKNIESTGASSVAGPLGKSKPEEPPSEEKPAAESDSSSGSSEEQPSESASAEVSSAGATSGLSPFDITFGLRPFHRVFEFRNTLADVRPNDGFSKLPRYELPLGPILFLDLNWFPASHFTQGAAEWIGIAGGYEKAIATKSVYGESTGNPTTLTTDEQQFYVGPQVRIPLGGHQLGLSGTFGQHTFALKDESKPPRKPLPNVKYTYIRPRAEGLLRFGDLMIGAHVGMRFVMGVGELKSNAWFPNVKTKSLEAGGLVGYRLASMLDLVAGFDWLRYAFDFNPAPARPAGYESWVAGGAVDEYLSGYLALRFHVPGASEKAAAAAATPAEGGE
jgi:hypothetical protein